MKKILLFIVILSTTTLSGCFRERERSADEKTQARQERIQAEGERQNGLPNIVNYSELKNVNFIYEKRDQANLTTYLYTKAEMTGALHFIGKGVGFGLPYATQRSSPTKIVRVYYRGVLGIREPITVPQSEPNGLFMPSSADATWQFIVNRKTGKIELTYFEDKLNVFQSPQPCNNPQDVY